MAQDTARASDGGATATVRQGAEPRGKFKVIAADGVSISSDGKDLSAKKGETVELSGAAIQALLNDGAIEPA
jgi:hypothetical protein